MATQVFREDVGQAVAGDLVNSGVVINIGSAPEEASQELVPAQRRALNALVRKITDEFDDEPWDIWRMLHAKLGVTCIDELCRSQFERAESVLQRYLDQKREESVIRGLVAKILRISNEKAIRGEVELYCTRQYGTSQFKALGREQLQAVLGYAYDWAPPLEQAFQEPASMSEAPTVAVNPLEDGNWRTRVYGWQWLVAVFVMGFFIGRFFEIVVSK